MWILAFILSGIMLATATVTLPKDPTWESHGLDACNQQACIEDGIAGLWVDFNTAIENLPTVCNNLIDLPGDLGYVADERRLTCIQMANGDNAYKWEFAIWRNKCSLTWASLDYHSCVDIYTNVMDGRIDWCINTPGKASLVVGGHQQVGCFDLSSSARPGLCAGSLPIGATL